MKRFTGFLTAALIFAGTSCFASDQGDAGDRLRWEQKFLRVDRGERFDLLDRSTHRVVLRDLASVFGTYDHERIAIVKRGDRVGALSFDGHLLVPIEYERIDVVEEARVLVVRREGKYGLVGLDGKKRTKLDYDDIDSSYRQHLAWRVKRGGLYGVLNPMTGRLVVAPRYANISIDSPFILAHGAQKVSANVGSEVFDLAGRAIPNTKGGMVKIWQMHKLVIVDGSRVVDAAGRVVVENDGLGGIYPIGPRAKAVYRGKARLIDPHGEFVSNRAWDDLIPLSGARDRLALAVENQAGRDEKHYGVITAHGVEVTPVKWDSVTRRSARYGKPKEIEYFVVTRDGTTNSLSSDGELLFDRGFEIVRMRGYDDPLFDVFRDGKFGVCDLSEGFCPIPPRYDSLRRAGRFSPGSDLYIAEREGRYGLINPADEAILPFQFDDIRSVTGKPGFNQFELEVTREFRVDRMRLSGDGKPEWRIEHLPGSPIGEQPYDLNASAQADKPIIQARFLPKGIASEKDVQESARRGVLKSLAFPSIQIADSYAYANFGQFVSGQDRLAQERWRNCPTPKGFRLEIASQPDTDAICGRSNNVVLVFSTRPSGELYCENCQEVGIPAHWTSSRSNTIAACLQAESRLRDDSAAARQLFVQWQALWKKDGALILSKEAKNAPHAVDVLAAMIAPKSRAMGFIGAAVLDPEQLLATAEAVDALSAQQLVRELDASLSTATLVEHGGIYPEPAPERARLCAEVWYVRVPAFDASVGRSGPPTSMTGYRVPKEGDFVRGAYPFILMARDKTGRMRLAGVSKEFIDLAAQSALARLQGSASSTASQ